MGLLRWSASIILEGSLPDRERPFLFSEGQNHPIHGEGTALAGDPVFLEGTNGLPEGWNARFPGNNAPLMGHPHDDEIGLQGIVIEVDEQLQQAGGIGKERDLPPLEILLKGIKGGPEDLNVLCRPHPSRHPEGGEVTGKGTMLCLNVPEDAGTQDHRFDLPLEADAGERLLPAASEKLGRILGCDLLHGIAMHRRLEMPRFDHPQNHIRRGALTVGDGHTELFHQGIARWNRRLLLRLAALQIRQPCLGCSLRQGVPSSIKLAIPRGHRVWLEAASEHLHVSGIKHFCL